jgi:hypothetical protein
MKKKDLKTEQKKYNEKRIVVVSDDDMLGYRNE